MSTTYVAAIVALYLAIGGIHWRMMQVWDHLNGTTDPIDAELSSGNWRAVTVRWSFIIGWPVFLIIGRRIAYREDRDRLAYEYIMLMSRDRVLH